MESKNKIAYAVLFAAFAVFGVIALKGLKTPQPGDENVYFYMAKLINEGKIPYRDFFYAHPPVHLYLLSLIYGISGFNIFLLKVVPFASALIAALFIFMTAKNKFGIYEAIISSLLFLFSYSVMFNSVFSLGALTATMLLTIGFYFFYSQNNYYLAGIFFGLASATRLLALVPIIVVLIFALFADKKNFIKLLSVFLAVFLIINGFFMLIAGYNYIDSVYKFHFYKLKEPGQNFSEYFDVIKLNWPLFLAALTALFIKNKPVRLLLAVSITYLLFLFTLKKLFGFYFLIVFPLLAVLAGYSIMQFYKSGMKKSLKILVLAVMLALFFWNLSSDVLFLQKIGFRGFERGEELMQFVKLNSNTDTRLFGDASVAPLLALMSNRDIALDFADTNDQIFSSGIIDIDDLLQKLKNEEILFILRDKGLSSLIEIREFVSKNCEFLGSFKDELEGNYIFYRC